MAIALSPHVAIGPSGVANFKVGHQPSVRHAQALQSLHLERRGHPPSLLMSLRQVVGSSARSVLACVTASSISWQVETC